MSPSYPPSPMTNGSSGGPSTEPLKTISSPSSSSSSSVLSALSVAEVDSEGYHVKPKSIAGNGNVKNKGKGKDKGTDTKTDNKDKNKDKNKKRPLDEVDSDVEKETTIGKKAKAGGKKDKATGTKAKIVENASSDVEGAIELEKGAYCHQCRTRAHPDDVLRCTKLKQFSRLGPPRACNRAYCDNCLERRYGYDPEDIRQLGGEDDGEEHVENVDWGYTWTCPCCNDVCQNSVCRRKKGLEPVGTIWLIVHDSELDGRSFRVPKSRNKHKAPKRPIDSSTIDIDEDSSLSDLDSIYELVDPFPDIKEPKPKSKPEPKPKSKPEPKPKPKLANGKVTKKAANGKPTKSKVKAPKEKSSGKSSGAADKKTASKGKGKGKGKETVKEKKPRAKPKKQEIVVEPPVFENVDTKLSREEAEQRIYLREYLNRFRPVLAFPERSLPALDDFDRSLTEASVRSFAGAMLDVIREQLELDGGDEWLVDELMRHRDELKYYADLARFASIFNSLVEPLHLRLPVVIEAAQRDTNESAIRALLDLPDDEPVPAWAADSGPSRRTGASRLPQPAEVIRMLLALAERTLETPAIKVDIDITAGEADVRRKNADQVKRAVTTWEARRKKLSEMRIRCKTAAETKANKELTEKEHHEHIMKIFTCNVNLRASLARRLLRHEPLGVDLDGRIYYCLTPRAIDDDSRPPLGWASGLLVWGIGVPRPASASVKEIPDADDELPIAVERWCHFGKSSEVKLLIKWIEYRFRKAVEARKPKKKAASTSTPKKTGKEPTPTKSVLTQSKLKNTFTPSSSSKTTSTPPNNTSNTKVKNTKSTNTPSRSKFEVVIPVSAKKVTASNASASSDSALSALSTSTRVRAEAEAEADQAGAESESDESDLSSVTTDEDESEEEEDEDEEEEYDREELLQLVNPEGYVPSIEVLDEQGKELVRRLSEVVEWLEVLEWKGMGEVY